MQKTQIFRYVGGRGSDLEWIYLIRQIIQGLMFKSRVGRVEYQCKNKFIEFPVQKTQEGQKTKFSR